MTDSYTVQDVETLLGKLNAPEDFAGKDALWQRIAEGLDGAPAAPRRPRYKKPLQVALLAAAIFVLAITVATAAGQLISGKLSVSTTDRLYSNGERIKEGAHITYPGQQPFNPETQAKAFQQTDYTWVDVRTADAAKDILGFSFKAPAWVPPGYALSEVKLCVGEAGFYDEAVVFKFASTTPEGALPPGALVNFSFDARYIGPDATMEIEATGKDDEVQFTTVGGCEAVILPTGGLFWIDDGIAYSLSTHTGLEDALRMAESLLSV